VLVEEAIAFGALGAAVDHSAEVLEWARRRRIPVFLPSDDLPNCDVLRFSHVLEHVPRPREVLAAVLRSLNPGGLVCITQPNFPVFKAEPSGDVILKDSVWPNHLHFFSPLSLTTMLASLGLEVFRFDTHPPHEARDIATFRDRIDIQCAESSRLAGVNSLLPGETSFPLYLGQNSDCWARRMIRAPRSRKRSRSAESPPLCR